MANKPSEQDANNEFQPKTKAMSEREAVSTLAKSLFDNYCYMNNHLKLYVINVSNLCCNSQHKTC